MLTEETNEIEETAFFIAGHLNETKQPATKLIRQIVQVLGTEQALSYLQQSREIEKAGGMLIMNGKRRRTPGGTFFYLVRSTCSQEQVSRIWPNKEQARTSQEVQTAIK
jgi:phosphorylated adapter RNA export protein